MKKSTIVMGAIVGTAVGLAPLAQAHTSFVVKEGIAGKNVLATLNVGHGCGIEVEGEPKVYHDTYKLVLDIPDDVSVVSDTLASVTLRPMDAAWGKASVVKDDSGKIIQLVWTKPGTPEHGADMFGYQASFTVKLPDAKFTKVVFPAATQYCIDENGTEVETAWEGQNAPYLRVMPSRSTGWNKYTAPADMDEAAIKTYFADALIVWVGDKAYSSNTNTDSAITNKLTSISKDDIIWVKY